MTTLYWPPVNQEYNDDMARPMLASFDRVDSGDDAQFAGWALLLTQAAVLAGSDDAGQKSAPSRLSFAPHPPTARPACG